MKKISVSCYLVLALVATTACKKANVESSAQKVQSEQWAADGNNRITIEYSISGSDVILSNCAMTACPEVFRFPKSHLEKFMAEKFTEKPEDIAKAQAYLKDFGDMPPTREDREYEWSKSVLHRVKLAKVDIPAFMADLADPHKVVKYKEGENKGDNLDYAYFLKAATKDFMEKNPEVVPVASIVKAGMQLTVAPKTFFTSSRRSPVIFRLDAQNFCSIETTAAQPLPTTYAVVPSAAYLGWKVGSLPSLKTDFQEKTLSVQWTGDVYSDLTLKRAADAGWNLPPPIGKTFIRVYCQSSGPFTIAAFKKIMQGKDESASDGSDSGNEIIMYLSSN